jgi:putative peptidoglycan lipid II flippase
MAVPQMESETSSNNRKQIIQAATIVGAAFIVSRFLGIVRDAVFTFYFDIETVEANAYFIASRFPETIFLIIAGGALGSAFIPTFSAYFVRDDERGAWRLFSAIINLVVIVMTIIAIVIAWFSPQIITLFYSDLMTNNTELLDMTVSLLRLMLITPIIFGVSGVIMAALNARQHFLLPAVAPIVYNLGIIAGIVVFAPNVMGLAIGTLVGAIGHLLIQIPGLYAKKAHYSPIITVRDPGVQQVVRLMAPRVLGLSFAQLNHLLIQFLAQSMVLGSIPALTFAWRIMIMPQAVIGQALAIAAFPTFATLAAQNAFAEMRRILADTLRLIFFLSLPAGILLMILRIPIVSVLFERGQFDETATEFVGWALLFYSLSLIGLAAIEIISRAFYAMEDTWTPVLVGMLQLGVMWILGWWLGNVLFPSLGWIEMGGLALGYTISTLLELILLLWLLRRKLGGISGRRVFDGVWRMLLASILMAVVTWLVLQSLVASPKLIQLVLTGAVGALVYLIASAIFGVTELRDLLQNLLSRIRT